MSDETAAKQPVAKPTEPQQPAQPKASPDLLFYNVMPQKNKGGEVIDPTVTVAPETESGAQASGHAREFFKKYRKYIFLGLGVVILGIGGYIALTKLVLKQYQTEDLLVHKTNDQVQHDQTSASQATSTTTTSKEWQLKYFGSEVCQKPEICGDQADLDLDGLVNEDEFKQGSDPNNKDSDGDGLSDGDEAHVFGTLVLDAHTAKDPNYNDADFIKGGYSIQTGKEMTPVEKADLSKKMNDIQLHQPTLTTLKDVLVPMYNFGVAAQQATSTPDSATSTPDKQTATSSDTSALNGLDVSVEAKQDRDAQRSATIKNIEIALVKYEADHGLYPQTTVFPDMFEDVRLYLKVATKSTDPINKEPYVYAYTAGADGKDFTLSFYSEVAGQIIKKHAADAQKDASLEQANIYDEQRKSDLQMLQSALLIYSNQNVDGNQDYVFPLQDKYKTALVPQYITQIPKDPKTGADYEYKVSATFNTFTLKTLLDNPSAGTTGWLCNQEECRAY